MVAYEVGPLQAVEPDALPRDEDVSVFVHDELDWQGFNEVTVSASTPEAVVEYVRRNWGDEDAAWFDEYVAGAVREITAEAAS